MKWHNRHQKNELRSYVFNNKNTSKCYLTLPGSDCVDIEVGLKEKILDTSTQIIGIENNLEAFISASKWKKKHPELNFQLIHGNLEDYEMLVPADIVYLDFLGNLTGSTALWVRDKLKLAKNADIVITVSTIIRNNSFIPECIEFFKTQPYWKDYTYPLRSCKYDSVDLLATYWILLERFFGFSQNTIKVEAYKDTASMFFIKLENVRRVSGVPSLVKKIEEIATMSQKTNGKSRFVASQRIPTFLEVVFAGLEANSPGKKAVYTKYAQKYIAYKVAKGHRKIRIMAAIKARITKELHR